MNALAHPAQLNSGPSLARTASLAMYDLDGLQATNDALWAAIAAALEDRGVVGAPQTLLRGAPLDTVWTDPDLLLAQTCGYPLGALLNAHGVRLIATPRYRAPGCEGPYHRSAVVVRTGSEARTLADLFGLRGAVNDHGSNSGMNLLRFELAPLSRDGRFFSAVVVTGSHQASAEQVAAGEADVAALDCITWAHLQRLRPALTQRLRMLSWTVRSPGLPLITGRDTDVETRGKIRSALEAVAHDPALRDVRAALMLDGFSDLPVSHYRVLAHFEQTAIYRGYPALA